MSRETTKEKGVLYIATGEEYVAEAAVSAESLARHNDLHVTLVSDRNYNYNVFDNVILLDSPRFDEGDSIPRYQHLVYDRTLVLDSDTYICNYIGDIFTPLDYFDVGCSMNEDSGTKYSSLERYDNQVIKELPDSFYEYNTGVLVFRKCEKVKRFLGKWRRLYNQQTNFVRNQPSFRYALYDSDIRYFTLPKTYNYRLPKLAEVDGPIKIIHGRHPSSFEDVERCINRSHDSRVITRTGWPMGVIRSRDFSWEWRVRFNVGRYGVVGVIRMGVNKIIDEIRRLWPRTRSMSGERYDEED